MTDREKAIVTAYTGVTMLSGEKFQIFHEYIEKILGRPVWTHELAIELVWNEIKEKSKDDFIEICKTEDKRVEKPTGHWLSMCEYCEKHNLIPSGIGSYCWCSKCEYGLLSNLRREANFCPNCGADMRGGRE